MKIRAQKFLPGENSLMVFIAACIGLGAGLANIGFRSVTELVRRLIFEPGYAFVSQGGWHILLLPLIPMTGMALLIPFSLLFPGEVNGYGFTNFLRKVNLQGGYIGFRTIILRTIACALTIGTGNSAGVEGPIAQVGGALGSQVGRFFRVSSDRMKVYIAAGCAGGVAAMFNAPIAGMFFASEIVLLGTYEMASFSALVIASALATVLSRAYYGAHPAFPITDFTLVNPAAEIPLYILMGVWIGILSVLHIKVFYWVRDWFASLAWHPQLQPVAGGLLIGVIAIFFPQVMGDGYQVIKAALADHVGLGLMAALILLKIVATAVTLGSGGAGGVFAPALFIGAMAGGSFGWLAHHLFPAVTATAGAYAAVGVGAFLAASTHAPLTAIFLLFEMTGDSSIIIPIMLASVIGAVVSARLNHDSIDTVDFSREGIDISEGRETAIMRSIKVGRVMREDVDFIGEEAKIDQLLHLFSLGGRSFYFPVIDQTGAMTGIVSLQDVRNALHDEARRCTATVGEVCARRVVFLTPDDTLYTALSLFDQKGFEELPVVESKEHLWVVGMLKRRDAINAYNAEVVKRGISARSCPVALGAVAK
ncbi:MAG: chloride channel protein [Desulfobacteraceae bacterium]|nr:chloride channel protein [Desulfobacteraceae bacterium]